MIFSQIETTTSDGIKLRGLYVQYMPTNLDEQATTARLLVFMHGKGGHLPDKCQWFMKVARALKVDIVAFSFRGFT
jgi:hypothetical protein